MVPTLGTDDTLWWKLASIISCGTLAGAVIATVQGTIIFVFAVATLQPLAIYSKANNPGVPDSLALAGGSLGLRHGSGTVILERE